MKYLEIIIEDENDKPEGSSELDLPLELYNWMKSENIRQASLHTLWFDFPLRRHLPTSRDWAKVLTAGDRRGYWDLETGRQEGSKIVTIGKSKKNKS